MEAPLDMNSNRIINLPEPVDPTDAATKGYLDEVQAAVEAAEDAVEALLEDVGDQVAIAEGHASTASAAAGAAQAAETAAEFAASQAIAAASVVVSVLDYGAVGDGVTNDRVAIQAALDSGYSQITIPDGDYLIAGTLTVPSGVWVKAHPGANLINARLSIQGSVGSEIAFTGATAVGATSLPINTTGLAANDYLFVMGCVNVFSTDAGTDQIGTDPGPDELYFAEFSRVTSILSGSSAEVYNGMRFGYSNTPGPNSTTRTSTTARKVTFATGGWSGGKFTGSTVGANEIIYKKWCREYVIEHVTFEVGTNTVNVIVEANSLDCTDRFNIVHRKHYDGYSGSGVSLRNSFLLRGSHNWRGHNNVVDGGFQACDMSYDVDATVTVGCQWVHNTVRNAYELGTAHQGSIACRIDYNLGHNINNGPRLRSVRSSASFNVIRGLGSATGGTGIFVAEGYMEGNTIIGNIVEGFLYGCNIQLTNPISTVVTPGRSLVSTNSFLDCQTGVNVTAGDATSAVRGPAIRGNNFHRMTNQGVLVGLYANGTVVEGNSFYGPFGGSARAGVEYTKNISGLVIRNNTFLGLGAGIYGIRGFSVSTHIDDLATFPLGNADAHLLIDGNRFFSHATGFETVSIVRDVTAFDNVVGGSVGVWTRIGRYILRQISTVVGIVLDVQNASGTSMFSVDEVGLTKITGGAYNSGHLQMGSYHYWNDGSGLLRVKSSAPTSASDGTLVGAGAITSSAITTALTYTPVNPTLTLTAGAGLTGGGTLAANRTFAVDITGQTALTAVDANADYLLIYDTSAAAFRKVLSRDLRQEEQWTIAVGDETTALTTGTAKVTFRAPYAFVVTAVRASLNTVSSSGIPTFDINEGGTSILGNKLTIDVSEKTSTTAATAATITDPNIADDAEMTIDIDVAGTGAKGAKIVIYGYRV